MIKLRCLIVLLVVLFLSCEKQTSPAFPNANSSVEIGEFYKTIKEVLNEGYTSPDNFINRISSSPEVINVRKEGNLIFIASKSGFRYSIDLYGSSRTGPIVPEDKIDTCGTAIKHYLKGLKTESELDFENSVEEQKNEERILDVEGNLDDETRATTSLDNRMILYKKTAALWNPWAEFYQEDIDFFKYAIEDSDFNYSIFTSFSPASIGEWKNYDLVYIGSHGCEDGALCLPTNLFRTFLYPYIYMNADGEEYLDEKEADDAGYRLHVELGENGITECFALEKKILDILLPDLSNTIIWTSACYLGREDSIFKKAALSKNCPEFYGADGECRGEGPMSVFMTFLPLWSSGASTKVAYEYGMQIFHKVNHDYNYIRYGNKNLTYVKPIVTGAYETSLRWARIGVNFQFSQDITDAILSNTPNCFGILLTNLYTGQRDYIKLSNSNIAKEFTLLYDPYQNLLPFSKHCSSVNLFGLSPETRYKYSAYVQVGGKIILSEYYQVFTTQGLNGNWEVHQYDDINVQDAWYYRDQYFWYESLDPYSYQGDLYVLWDTFYSTRIEGNSISCIRWYPGLIGPCGAFHCDYCSGTISNDWSHIFISTAGFCSYIEKRDDCIGDHHHDLDYLTFYDMYRVTDGYCRSELL